ncbi:MAG TPA: hypothetical protein DDY37_05775 [Legionella sp.]|nr:hypothetical protein [Legionella sp.]
MDRSLHAIIATIRERETTMVAQLHQFCSINSGTENQPGLKAMHQALAEAFRPLADEIQTITMPAIPIINMNGDASLQTCGDALLIRKRPHLKRRVLLSGHMDTVYGVHHAFQTLTSIDNNTVRGPGIADMKGGLIVMLHALHAFEQTTAAHSLGWDVFINADEEIGSPASSLLFAEIIAPVQAALVYEPAMTASGTFAKNRKGSGKLTLVARGRAAHAGRSFEDGRNAICYLADIIHAVHALNGLKDGVTINVGLMAGGDALNVVPDTAVAKLDVRITEPEDAHWVCTKLDAIINALARPDYSLQLHGGFHRPVKRVNAPTTRLFERLQRIASALGLRLDWQNSGGCCDGNNFSAHSLPVIDTLGVRGGEIHSANEFILLDSLEERASLSALLLVDLAEGGLEELLRS